MTHRRLVLYATLIWGAIMCGWLVVDAVWEWVR